MTERKSIAWLKKNLKYGSILKQTYSYGIEIIEDDDTRKYRQDKAYKNEYRVLKVTSSSFEMRQEPWGYFVKQKWPKAKDIRFTDNGFEVYDECGVPQNRKYQLWARYEIVKF